MWVDWLVGDQAVAWKKDFALNNVKELLITKWRDFIMNEIIDAYSSLDSWERRDFRREIIKEYWKYSNSPSDYIEWLIRDIDLDVDEDCDTSVEFFKILNNREFPIEECYLMLHNERDVKNLKLDQVSFFYNVALWNIKTYDEISKLALAKNSVCEMRWSNLLDTVLEYEIWACLLIIQDRKDKNMASFIKVDDDKFKCVYIYNAEL